MVKEIVFSPTEIARDRMGDLFEEDPESGIESYKGKPVIHHDGPINGGVYVGSSSREAIVVDDIEDEALKSIYGRFMDWIIHDLRSQNLDYTKSDLVQALLNQVDKFTNTIIPTNKPYSRQFEVMSDELVLLSKFFNQGGTCRHKALLTGYLIERLISEPNIIHRGANLKIPHLKNAQVSIDRKHLKDKGGHAWIRFTVRNQVYIIDPTLHLVGKLGTKNLNEYREFYEREEDTLKGKVRNLTQSIKTRFGSVKKAA